MVSGVIHKRNAAKCIFENLKFIQKTFIAEVNTKKSLEKMIWMEFNRSLKLFDYIT